jgi:hypothetical protein
LSGAWLWSIIARASDDGGSTLFHDGEISFADSMSVRSYWFVSIGVALLYASAFYLPDVGSGEAYWLALPGRQILYPSAIAILVMVPLMAWFQSRLARNGLNDRIDPIGVLVLAVFCWIAAIGAFSAAGYSALNVALVVSASDTNIEATRWTRIGLVLVGLTSLLFVIVKMRRKWRELLRFLAILGYVYAVLAAIRLEQYPLKAFDVGAGPSLPYNTTTTVGDPAPRQVIWIIFDELDYDQTLQQMARLHEDFMPNLAQLSRLGVSALQAYSPAKDTVASIPALLTGYPLKGLDFSIGYRPLLRTRNDGTRGFQQSDSVFSRIPGGPQSAAILGFYHPYCTLFPAVNPCLTWPDQNAGRWFDALAFFGQPAIATSRLLPGSSTWLSGDLFRQFEPMYRITEVTLREFPRFLSLQDKSLVYIHVNLPHAPADFSQRVLHLGTVGDDREDYRRNLKLVDRLLGDAFPILRERAQRQKILLIVSSDHWHRIDSPRMPRRIPWLAWQVGDTDGQSIDDPISTVHTADLVVAFLRGEVTTQPQIHDWWKGKPVYPTLMPNGYLYDGK